METNARQPNKEDLYEGHTPKQEHATSTHATATCVCNLYLKSIICRDTRDTDDVER
jgi:hypothetical protein